MAAGDWVWMACLCVTGAGGHWLLIKTYDVAEASQVQPFAYFQLVFAAGLGMLVFGETLEWNVAVGAVIVVAAGVFTLWRARVVATLAQQPLRQADLRQVRRSAAPRRWRGFRSRA
jgi:drug/metabolite transporter (DMT)-like permease